MNEEVHVYFSRLGVPYLGRARMMASDSLIEVPTAELVEHGGALRASSMYYGIPLLL